MDVKVTLSFNASIVEKAKEYAEGHGISLSRLTEILLGRLTAGGYSNIEDFPVSEWVNMVAEGPAEYISRQKTNKKLQSEYHKGKRKAS